MCQTDRDRINNRCENPLGTEQIIIIQVTVQRRDSSSYLNNK